MISDPDRPEDPLHQALQPTADCIAVARYGEPFTAAEREHLNGCTRCQAELALWQEFMNSTPSATEGAAVEWVAAEVRRRRARDAWSTAPSPWWSWVRLHRLSAAAALVAAVVTYGYLSSNREPRPRELQHGEQSYRTAQLQALAPLGDVPSAPHVFEWVAFRGAVRYDLRVLEVDGTVFWQASSPVPRVDVPAAVIQQFVPGKTVLWQVAAQDASGAVLVESAIQQFRVALNHHPPGERHVS